MATKSTIMIEPLARVEGHGGIKVEIKDNKIKSVEVQVLEGPRMFEVMAVGKTPEEDISIVPRICAICNLSHKYSALRGLEKALGIQVPEIINTYRHLMHHGEMIESHSLHVFFLALPDFLGYPNAVAMADKYGKVVTNALRLKKFGNMVMKTMGGRMIHGENPILGGFGKLPDEKTLLAIKQEASALIPFALETIDLLSTLQVPDFMERDTQYLCCKPPHAGYDYYGDTLMTSDGKEYPLDSYKSVITERVVPHSFAKRCSYLGKPYSVGALARVLLLGSRLKGDAKTSYKKLYNKRWPRNPLYNNFAQAIEMVHSLDEIKSIVDKLLGQQSPSIVKPTRLTGMGTGGVEAPRGTLIHHYELKDGKTTAADIITPTAMFLDDIEAFIRKGGEELLAKGQTTDLELRFEMIARSYDPCISCSAHMVTLEFK